MPMKADDPNFKGFRAPQYTQVPNEVFDHLLPDMDETELRVTLIAIRKTLGWHKTRDAISLSTFVELTGLSRQGVLDGIEKAKARGTLAEVGKGKRGVNIYELVITEDQSTELTSLTSRPVLVYSVDQSNAPTSLTSRPTKEKKKRNTKETCVVWSAAELAMSEMFASLTSAMVKPHEEQSAKLVEQNRKEAQTLITNGVTPETLKAFYRETYTNGYVPSSLAEIRKKIGAWQVKHAPKALPSTNGNLQNTVRLYGLVGDVE